MELSESTVISISKDNVYCNIEDEIIMLGLEDEVYYGLNSVGAFVWEQIKNPKTFAEILNAVLNEYDIEREECERDLRELITELFNKGLVEVEDEKL